MFQTIILCYQKKAPRERNLKPQHFNFFQIPSQIDDALFLILIVDRCNRLFFLNGIYLFLFLCFGNIYFLCLNKILFKSNQVLNLQLFLLCACKLLVFLVNLTKKMVKRTSLSLYLITTIYCFSYF